MHQSKKPAPTMASEANPQVGQADTAAVMAAADIASLKMGVVYPKLRAWPELAPAVAVHLNMTAPPHYRVPIKLMRKAGMRPELGVHLAVHGDRALMWGGEQVGRYTQNAESKQFILQRAGLGPRLSHAKFAIVEGPDYLIVTTRNEALKLAGNAPVHEHDRWEKLSSKSVTRRDDDLALESLEVLDWQDFNLFHSNRRTKTGVASVAGRLWWIAGFTPGAPVRFTRYKNATVIERCDPSEQHSILAQSKLGVPRHYIGASLFDFHKASSVRVVASSGRLIVTLLDSEIGALCAGLAPRVHCTKQMKAPTYRPALPAVSLAADALRVFAKKDCKKVGSSVTITGRIWNVAGFERFQPARAVMYANAVVIEPCDEAQMEFRIGTPSHATPYRVLSLAHTVLAKETRVRVLVCEGRLVLTGRNTDLGRKFRGVQDWPEPSKVDAFVETLFAPPVEPAVEVSSYPLPNGQRLQIQGKWLREFGFVPGAKYEVSADKQGVSLRLVADGGATVTQLNPGSGTSKLYVPAQSFGKLKTERVRVMGRTGELRILPMAA